MPNPVEGLLEVYEDTVKVLLVLEIFLTYSAWVEDLGHIMMYQLFQGHASWATSHCTVYFRGMSLTGPYHDVLYNYFRGMSLFVLHHDVLYISGVCLLLRARLSMFQGLGHIMMYCIFQEHVSCCRIYSLFQGLGHIMNIVYFRGMYLVVPHHDVLYNISGTCLLLYHIIMHCIFQEHVSCCGLDSLYFRGWATS